MATDSKCSDQEASVSQQRKVQIGREQILLLRQTAEAALWILLSPQAELDDTEENLDDLEQVATRILNTVARLKARKAVSPLQSSGSWKAFNPGP